MPRASYALSKMATELLLRHYSRSHGFAARITRYHNVYGPRMGYDHVIPQFIERLLAGEDPFTIYGAYQSRAFCYVDDAVEATMRLAALRTADPVVMNIGNDREELQIVDLARRLFDVAGRSPALRIEPPPPGSPERRQPDIGRLRELTGFEPRVQLDEGLRRTYAWYRQRRSALASPSAAGG
jgi:UDP-glucose 4-epimerase/UDP-glucuronate decarboxylase